VTNNSGAKRIFYILFFFSPNSSLGQMAFNVPAVCDVFAVAIKEREAFQQPQKCGGEKMHKGRKPDCIFS
jgi:hypothetical protein